MKRRILVTRPEPGAGATADRLVAMGFEPLLLPLTRIEPVNPSELPDPARYAAVAVTSANALRHAPAEFLARLKHLAVLAVGDRTAAAARQAGFATVHSAGGAIGELVALVAEVVPSGERILHLTGVEKTPGFALGLEPGGVAVDQLEVYRAPGVSYATDFLESLSREGAIDGVLVLSPRAGALLADLARQPVFREMIENAAIFCISRNAAASLPGEWSERISISSAPTEDAVLALLSAFH